MLHCCNGGDVMRSAHLSCVKRPVASIREMNVAYPDMYTTKTVCVVTSRLQKTVCINDNYNNGLYTFSLSPLG